MVVDDGVQATARLGSAVGSSTRCTRSVWSVVPQRRSLLVSVSDAAHCTLIAMMTADAVEAPAAGARCLDPGRSRDRTFALPRTPVLPKTEIADVCPLVMARVRSVLARWSIRSPGRRSDRPVIAGDLGRQRTTWLKGIDADIIIITHYSHFLLNFQLPTGFVLVG